MLGRICFVSPMADLRRATRSQNPVLCSPLETERKARMETVSQGDGDVPASGDTMTPRSIQGRGITTPANTGMVVDDVPLIQQRMTFMEQQLNSLVTREEMSGINEQLGNMASIMQSLVTDMQAKKALATTATPEPTAMPETADMSEWDTVDTRPTVPDHSDFVRSDRREDRPKLVYPQKFTGTTSWSEFFLQFQTTAEMGRWSDKTKVNMLGLLLDGDARTHWSALPMHTRMNYQELVSSLQERFQDRANVAQAKLEARVRSPGEDIQTLATDLYRLASRAYPDFPPEYTERIALDALKRAVDVNTRVRLNDQKVRSVPEAVHVIEEYESILEADNTQARRRPVRAVSFGTSDGEVQALKERLATAEASRMNFEKSMQDNMEKLNALMLQMGTTASNNARYNRPADDKSRRIKSCFNCGATGTDFHYKRDCPKLQGNGQPSA